MSWDTNSNNLRIFTGDMCVDPAILRTVLNVHNVVYYCDKSQHNYYVKIEIHAEEN